MHFSGQDVSKPDLGPRAHFGSFSSQTECSKPFRPVRASARIRLHYKLQNVPGSTRAGKTSKLALLYLACTDDSISTPTQVLQCRPCDTRYNIASVVTSPPLWHLLEGLNRKDTGTRNGPSSQPPDFFVFSVLESEPGALHVLTGTLLLSYMPRSSPYLYPSLPTWTPKFFDCSNFCSCWFITGIKSIDRPSISHKLLKQQDGTYLHVP